MMLRGCSWEAELTRALKAGHWPDACGPELGAHVEGCRSCSDLVLVAETFRRARTASAEREPGVPANLLWWRAELRRRNEAAQKVTQPITVAQSFAWVVSSLVALVFLVSQYRYGLRWGSWWPELSVGRIVHQWSVAGAELQWRMSLLIPCVGMLAVLSGIAVYLVKERE
ncbi:MAG TPA: hypothetical protein VKV39_07265 [Candidatus Sulfotelmatobacter sp.]|nr:hypothetical protein [Candidatus Sulfotelmatobacter sp.]